MKFCFQRTFYLLLGKSRLNPENTSPWRPFRRELMSPRKPNVYKIVTRAGKVLSGEMVAEAQGAQGSS